MTVGQTRRTNEQLADRAYAGLRDRIVDLRLPPGTALREDELMLEMSLGRTPLREAVKRLALEHLVEVRPRRATIVTAVEAQDIARCVEVRAALEAHAARLAAERMPEELRDHASLLAAGLAEVPVQDTAAIMLLDERIHRFAWRASGNPYLEATLDGYWALSLRVWHLVLARVPSPPRAVHPPAVLLDALLSGDGERAETVMREHVLGFERTAVEAIEG